MFLSFSRSYDIPNFWLARVNMARPRPSCASSLCIERGLPRPLLVKIRKKKCYDSHSVLGLGAGWKHSELPSWEEGTGKWEAVG